MFRHPPPAIIRPIQSVSLADGRRLMLAWFSGDSERCPGYVIGLIEPSGVLKLRRKFEFEDNARAAWTELPARGFDLEWLECQ